MANNELQLIDFYHGNYLRVLLSKTIRIVNLLVLLLLSLSDNHGSDLVKEAKSESDDLATRMADSIYFSSPEARASVQAAAAAAAAAAANPAPAAK